MLHMIVEQTWEYPMRMAYDPEAKRFVETEYESLPHRRRFTKPDGWIKESRTPALGDEIEIRVIGVFKRSDLDHKYVAVEASRGICDLSELTGEERAELNRLYPQAEPGGGWFGKKEAE